MAQQPTVDKHLEKGTVRLSISDPQGGNGTANDVQQGQSTPVTSWLPSLSLPSLPDILPPLGIQSLLPLGKPLADPPVSGDVPTSPPRRPPSPIREESQATIRPSRAVQATPSDTEPSDTTSPSRSSTSTAYDVPVGDEPATASRRSRFRAFRSKKRTSSVVSTESALSRVSTRVSELRRKNTGSTVRVGSKGLRPEQRLLPNELECLQQLTPPPFAVGPVRKGSSGSMDSSAILAMSASLCGRWLASAGRNQVVYIWERVDNLYATLPARAFVGHEGEILDLAWSKGGFLLSCGMDKVVRIWHPEKEECLGEFEHDDYVTSVAFHPVDDRFFATTAMDRKLRFWSAPERTVLRKGMTPSVPTAVAFSPDGKEIVTGGLKGDMILWETETMRSKSSIKVRSSRGKNCKASKITGITYGDAILVSSNDSRIRLYSADLKIKLKCKGHENQSSHIRASTQHSRVVSGSEDGYVYIWNTRLTPDVAGTSCEWFHADSACASVLLSEQTVLCATQQGVIMVYGWSMQHDAPPPTNWPAGITFLQKSRRSPSIPKAHLPLLPAFPPCPHPSHLRIRVINEPPHPAHGQNGLFTTKRIPSGTMIIPYLGMIHGQSEKHSESDYDLSLVRLGSVHPQNPTPGIAVELAIDADKMGNAARMVNDYRGTGRKANAEFRAVNGRMELWSLSTGAIAKGDEILVSYGKGFWQARD